jgi:hypothetical protein
MLLFFKLAVPAAAPAQLIDAKAGTLENVVDLGVTKVRAQATCKAVSDERTDVAINGAGLYTGPLKVPLGVQVRNSSLASWSHTTHV